MPSNARSSPKHRDRRQNKTKKTRRSPNKSNKPKIAPIHSQSDLFSGGTDIASRSNKILISYLRTTPLSAFPNYSVEFSDTNAFWVFYAAVIIVSYLLYNYLLIHILFIPALTFINFIHALITLYLMHWCCGTYDAFDTSEGRNTFWELLDPELEFTRSKKLFAAFPIILFLLACYEQEWRKRYYFMNLVALGICLVPKLPIMKNVRLFGFNS